MKDIKPELRELKEKRKSNSEAIQEIVKSSGNASDKSGSEQ